MTTTAPDIEKKTADTDVATILVINKENSFDLNLVYGGKTGAKPRRHDINQHTTQYDWKQPYTVWMAYGECDPVWLSALLTAITNDSKIIFIDACKPSAYSLEKSDLDILKPYIEKDQLQIITGGTHQQQAEKFVELLDIRLMDNWYPIIPTCMTIDRPSETHTLVSKIGADLNTKILYKNTIQTTTEKFLKNSLINAPLAYKENPLAAFKNQIRQKPALIVAAGPSLNKQLSTLKDNQDLFTILAVDTVWPILNKHGIVPDIILGIDGRSKPSWPINGIHPQTQLVVETGCSPELVWSHNANHVFTYAHDLIENCFNTVGGHADFLDTGGSVATSAFVLACHMGANPIILIGQDLALTDGKDHADGYLHQYSAQMLAAKTATGFDVDGYYTGKVRTERQLMLYKTWFEQRINEIPDTMVINATEGGARITGALQLPFSKVCEEIKKTNIRKISNTITNPTIINKNRMKNLIIEMEKLISSINPLIKLSNDGLKHCNIHEKTQKFELDKKIKKLDNINEKIRKIDTQTKFILEIFSQRDLEKVTRDAARKGENMTPELEIEMYKFIYQRMQDASKKAISMFGQILEFYKTLEKSEAIDFSLIEKFFKTV